MTPTPRRLLAAVLATAVGGGVLVAGPATAHNPRETPKGAPRMDLEVMVTPELEGRITPGGTDPVVSVDGFGNRFVVARKEDAQTVVGVDPRARAATRASAWAWTSSDDGLTWQNLDALPRGAEQLLPQGTARDVTSAGSVTLLAEDRGAVVVVHRVVAAGKGRLADARTTVVSPGLPGGTTSQVSLATNGKDAVVAAANTGAASTGLARLDPAGAAVTVQTTLEGSCDVAADPRPAAATFWAVCTDATGIALHRSRDGGASFAAVTRLPGTARATADVGPDGTLFVLSGRTLTRYTGARAAAQDLALPRGEARGTAFAVSARGRVAATTYTRSAAGEGWHVQVALFSPGSRPVWYDFADHDPATPNGATQPPSVATSVDTDPQGRLQLVWSSTFLHSPELDRPLLRNVFTARSVTS